MQKITQRGSWLLSALCLLAMAVAASAQSLQPTIAVPAHGAADSVSGALRHAQQLETENRWGEALSVYEEAIREYPNERSLNDRHDMAKIHYDLGRRYGDSSFLRALTNVPERQALDLYSEVLLKIESHYVTAPEWAALVARGAADLEIAVRDKGFQSRNLPGKSVQQIESYLTQLRQQGQIRRVRSRQDAVDAVSAAMQLARQQLQLSATSIAFEFACGAIGKLDTYSSYLTGDQLNDVYAQIEGNFVGLGIELKANNGALQIVKVITGSPADRAGMTAGDRITEIDGKFTAKFSTDQAADLLQGEEGSQVEVVTISPSNVTRRITVRREHIEVPSVDDVKIVDADFGVGYLKLTCFQKTTSRDMDAALWKLHREGMKSLIVDLRGNPGGLLTSSVEVADKFVDDGVIVSTRGRSALEDYNYTAHKAGTWHVPLVVLIDGDSASASEIFAGAIQDHHRGNLVGQRSYGKGSVQGIFPLSLAGSGVRLTTAKFYSPSGHPISHVGIQPDIVVHKTAKARDEVTTAAATTSDDAVLSAGVQAARRQTAKR